MKQFKQCVENCTGCPEFDIEDHICFALDKKISNPHTIPDECPLDDY